MDQAIVGQERTLVTLSLVTSVKVQLYSVTSPAVDYNLKYYTYTSANRILNICVYRLEGKKKRYRFCEKKNDTL